jgi:hypothetical protein
MSSWESEYYSKGVHRGLELCRGGDKFVVFVLSVWLECILNVRIVSFDVFYTAMWGSCFFLQKASAGRRSSCWAVRRVIVFRCTNPEIGV